MSFALVWEYEVAKPQMVEFETSYAPQGAWANLFGSHPGFMGVSLLRSPDLLGRYRTIDRWRSEADYEEFLTLHKKEYHALDSECEPYTLRETFLGAFYTV